MLAGMGCLFVGLALLLAVLMPFVFVNIMATALVKLHLGPGAAMTILLAIVLGSVVNIPVKEVVRTEAVVVDPLAVLGLRWAPARLRRVAYRTVIAVNLGGCVIPTALALYETIHVVRAGAAATTALAVATTVNVVVCYALARPVPGVGIAMPALVPPLVAAATALVLAPEHAVPVAFVAGVLGPLVGADLLHLREVERLNTGIASIGGAGTFDGILLSGVIAAYLA